MSIININGNYKNVIHACGVMKASLFYWISSIFDCIQYTAFFLKRYKETQASTLASTVSSHFMMESALVPHIPVRRAQLLPLQYYR